MDKIKQITAYTTIAMKGSEMDNHIQELVNRGFFKKQEGILLSKSDLSELLVTYANSFCAVMTSGKIPDKGNITIATEFIEEKLN